MWMQRSRILWLKERDRNTKFFNAKAVWRDQKNNTKKLVELDGVEHAGQEAMGAAATSYF